MKITLKTQKHLYNLNLFKYYLDSWVLSFIYKNLDFTESQNGRGWKGPLWVI